MILVCSASPSATLVDALNATGSTWKQAADMALVHEMQPRSGWAASVVMFDTWDETEDRCNRLKRLQSGKVLAVVDESWFDTRRVPQLPCDDMVVHTAGRGEITARLLRCLSDTDGSSVIRHRALRLDTDSYQASFDDHPLDLTYMEYELLRHFVSNPGVLFTREELLRDVWGYEYFGGGRTVDVHVRRLRAKFGQEHAHMIETVRSVGYMFARADDQAISPST